MMRVMETHVIEQREVSKPEFIRLPRPGSRCTLTGLSRSTLCELVVPCELNDFKPPVTSLVLKKRGAARGIRLVNYESLLDHLPQLEAATHHPPMAGANDRQSKTA
jgi:hypothetical protein